VRRPSGWPAPSPTTGGFAVLLAAYLLAAVWSAALFVRLRWAGALPPVPGYPTRPAPVYVPGPADRPAAVAGWLLLAAAVALPLFFVTPRSPAARWQVRAGAETGYTGQTSVDLTTTGVVQTTRAAAFEVAVSRPDGSLVTELNPGVRWRGDAFADYAKGKWTLPTRELQLFVLPPPPPPAAPGRDEIVLTYRPADGQHAPVLAEPAAFEPGRPIPVGSLVPNEGVRWWDVAGDGTIAMPLDRSPDPRVAGHRPLDVYRQTVRAGQDPDLGPGFALVADGGQSDDPVGHLLSLPTEGGRGVREWADGFLAKLVEAGKLPAEATRPAPPPRSGLWVRPRYYEAAARLFREHFAESGEFRYGLTLRRKNESADPVEDFLLHEKAGHCQRFASAAALALRAVGVPCALAVGFRGFDPAGDGKVTIRQEHAHAWVSVLVPRPDGLWHWLSLDPTPVEPVATTTADTWLGAAREVGRTVYADYIVGYDPDRRKEVFEAGRQHVADNGWNYLWGAAGVVLVAAVGMAVRRWPRRAATPQAAAGTGVGWYDAVIDALALAGHPVRPGQTPGEHAAEAAAALRADPRTAAVADVPTEAAAALYEQRYAGRPVSEECRSALAAAADRLRAAVTAGPRPGAT
jgi:hypothetical protein